MSDRGVERRVQSQRKLQGSFMATQPIVLVDMVRYLAGLSGRQEAFGAGFDAGGPEVMTYRETIERVARLRGRYPLIVEVPVLSPRLSSYWLHLVTPVNPRIARP